MCSLIRTDLADAYGFDFITNTTSKINEISNVKADSIAERAGLKNGHKILEINGESILDNVYHEQLISKILCDPYRVDLLVVSNLDGFLNKIR